MRGIPPFYLSIELDVPLETHIQILMMGGGVTFTKIIVDVPARP